MLEGPVSVVKALQDFFTNGRHGKKIEMSEFKELTPQDKEDFRGMLRAEGYEVEDATS